MKEVIIVIATFQGGKEKRTIFFSSPSLISELLERAETGFVFPCLKQGKCGKCKVQVSGKVSPVTDEEINLLSQEEIESGIRLACCTFADGNIRVNYSISVDYFQEFKRNILNFSDKINKNATYDLIYDIGTTTIEAHLVEKERNEKHKLSFKNPQISYGSDVMSRIKYAKDHSSCALCQCVREPFEYIQKMFRTEKCVVTGNTVMLHLFENKCTDGMLDYPFTPSEHFGYEKENIYFPACISAFIGADVTCGILKSGLSNQKNALFIDLGTNCEMAFSKGEEIFCCSVAAGPAFEGFSTSNGEIAKDGSVKNVFLDKNSICFETIDSGKPSGITGSGIIDLINVLLKKGILKKDGFLKDNFFIPGTDVFVTPDDLRQIQLANASVRAGIEILCEGENVSKIFLAGNFGNALNIQNCVDIGLFPKSFLGKTKFIGNASLEGATLLLEQKNRDEVDHLIKKCKSIELAGSDEFAKRYIENIDF